MGLPGDDASAAEVLPVLYMSAACELVIDIRDLTHQNTQVHGQVAERTKTAGERLTSRPRPEECRNCGIIGNMEQG
jgi:hypothetical protein